MAHKIAGVGGNYDCPIPHVKNDLITLRQCARILALREIEYMISSRSWTVCLSYHILGLYQTTLNTTKCKSCVWFLGCTIILRVMFLPCRERLNRLNIQIYTHTVFVYLAYINVNSFKSSLCNTKCMLHSLKPKVIFFRKCLLRDF